MSIPRATTPTLTLTFTSSSVDFTAATSVYVTLKQGFKKLTKTGNDLVLEEKSVAVYLTQAETLEFGEGDVKIQVNWTTSSGGRVASTVKTINMSEQLLDEVVS